MRSLIIVTAIAGLLTVAGDCKGPKKPKAQAAAVAEDAWWAVDVEEELEESLELDVEVALDHQLEPALVRFTHSGGETQATVFIGAQSHLFVVSADGEVSDW
jgi:hypothetical protein